MNINIYYGGRGVLEDPTLYVIKKIENVLSELRVNINRYNLYEMRNSIMTLPQTFKDCDGIILASSVEWQGIGGYMQLFLDACWLYGDKQKISDMFMTPLIISTTYGEKEGLLTLSNAWELLGGQLCGGFSSYVDDANEFEKNKEYGKIIERHAENIYRTISQNIKSLPSSSMTIKQNLIQSSIELTPQEGEQLSKYVSDEIYVQKQKEDIKELASFFKNILNDDDNNDKEFLSAFKTHFVPQGIFNASYMFIIEDRNEFLTLNIKNNDLRIEYEKNMDSDIIAKLKHSVLSNIINGHLTFQRAFMTGEMTAKGNFKTLRMLDQLFEF